MTNQKHIFERKGLKITKPSRQQNIAEFKESYIYYIVSWTLKMASRWMKKKIVEGLEEANHYRIRKLNARLQIFSL